MDSQSPSPTFQNPHRATKEGIVAVGGVLSTERLIAAYNNGIFPWYEEGQPVLWWSPDPRMVLFLQEFKVSKSLRKLVREGQFKITFNTAFASVIENCATIKRKGQGGTWITDEMQKAYIEMHQIGIATSVEVWENQKLVGGLYGVDLKEKKVFCGESMFSKKSNASKVAFYHLVSHFKKLQYKLVDCQVHNDHLESLGAREIPREEFLKFLSC